MVHGTYVPWRGGEGGIYHCEPDVTQTIFIGVYLATELRWLCCRRWDSSMIEYTACGVTCANTCTNVNQQWLSVSQLLWDTSYHIVILCKHPQYDNPEERGHGHMIATIHWISKIKNCGYKPHEHLYGEGSGRCKERFFTKMKMFGSQSVSQWSVLLRTLKSESTVPSRYLDTKARLEEITPKISPIILF